jgi:hypothetical protein
MASTQELLNAQKATCEQRIRDLMAQLDKEKAEAEAAAVAEAKVAVEAEVECQQQEAKRKAKAEANAKQVEANAIRWQEEANKKARVEIRKGKHKAEGPPAELGSAGVSTRGPYAQCVAAGKSCVWQGGHRAMACERYTRMKSTCSFTKKDAGPEPAADSDIEIIEHLANRPNTVKPTQGPVTIDIPAKSRPLGSRSGGTDLSEVIASIRGLVEVGILIQRELRGQRLAMEEHIKELWKHRRVMTESTKILRNIGTILNDWLEPVEELESGSRGEEDKEKDQGEEEGLKSVTESDTESEAEKVVEKEVEEEQKPEQELEKEVVEELAKEIEETMGISQ